MSTFSGPKFGLLECTLETISLHCPKNKPYRWKPSLVNGRPGSQMSQNLAWEKQFRGFPVSLWIPCRREERTSRTVKHRPGIASERQKHHKQISPHLALGWFLQTVPPAPSPYGTASPSAPHNQRNASQVQTPERY